MLMMEFLVRCPSCLTETKIVTEEADPIIYLCPGCERNVIIHNSTIYTVRKNYISNIMSKCKTKACGQLIATRLSNKAENIITSRRLNELHDLLEKPMDVSDFLKKLK